jgi:hypothetical protein
MAGSGKQARVKFLALINYILFSKISLATIERTVQVEAVNRANSKKNSRVGRPEPYDTKHEDKRQNYGAVDRRNLLGHDLGDQGR